MQILGLNKTTLLDYPGHVAATVFTGGCQFRCPFCHNGELVLNSFCKSNYTQEDIFSFLQKRKNILQGICITGGEPTLQSDLEGFIREVRGLGYLVKLDTNGYEPDVLERLLRERLLDYVAMDIKNSPGKYGMTVGREFLEIERVERSVKILKSSGIDYEFRTTVVRELHTIEDIVEIGKGIAGCPAYFLQQYQADDNVIEIMRSGRRDVYHGYDIDVMNEMAEAIKGLPDMTGEVAIRGVD